MSERLEIAEVFNRSPIVQPNSCVQCHVVEANSASLAEYRILTSSWMCGAAQTSEWLDAYAATSDNRLLFLRIEQEGKLCCIMPVELVCRGGCTVAQAVSGTHANNNFPYVAAEFPKIPANMLTRTVRVALQTYGTKIDLLLIERVSREFGGLRNPLLGLPNYASANLGLAMDLTPGFDEILDRIGRKRRMKKHRAQIRKFEAAGGYRYIEAKLPGEVERLLDCFLIQKGERFAKLCVENVFSEMRPFLLRLFTQALCQPRPSFHLHALEIGGKIRAVTGSSSVANRMICEFNSFADDELSQASPGDFLFFLNIEQAAREQYEIFDFSVGDEGYKRAWCDLVTRQIDICLPLTLKGRVYGTTHKGATLLKRSMKANTGLWQQIKAWRKRFGGTRSAP